MTAEYAWYDQQEIEPAPRANLPIADGAMAICQRGGPGGHGCGAAIRYSAAHQRWEHVDRGHIACFRGHR